MANTTITLTKAEIGNAIFEYVERKYPVRTTDLTIRSQYGKITDAIVYCEIKKQID